MPRNGSGTYSLPPIYLATPGTTIQAQQHNDPLTDIASAMTASVASDGQTPMTGILNMNANKITGLATATNPSDAVRFDQISDPSAVALATLQTYGWAITGNAPTIANIDATNTASGQYRFVTGATGTFPSGVIAADTGQIIMIRETVNEGSMIMAVGAGRFFWRALVAGTWGAWQEAVIAPANTAQGSIMSRGASSWAAIAPGTARQSLRMNAGATAPEWVDGDLFFRLNSAHAGADSTALQNFFPQAVTLEASTVYSYEFWIGATKTAGTTSHSFSVGFGGTHTRNNTFRHLLTSGQNNTATSATVLTFTGFSAAATDVVVTTFNAANGTIWHREFGTFSVNASGTWFPAYQLSAAPGGAWSTAAGSYVRLTKLGASGANNSQGPWA